MAITDTNLIAHNIEETDALAYDQSKYYLENDFCIYKHYLYQALKGDSIASAPEWSASTQYMPGQLVRVTEDLKIYRAVTGVAPSDYSEYNGALYYIVGQYCKMTGIKQVFKATEGEDRYRHAPWDELTEYSSGGYCRLEKGAVYGSYPAVEDDGKVYKSLKNTNSTNYPLSNLTGIDPYWSVAGYLNTGCPPDISILYSEWVAATAYTVGQKVKVTAAKAVFECLVANTGYPPVDNLLGAAPKWKQVDVFLKYQSDPALWTYAGTINEGYVPKDNISGDNPAWEEYGVINYNQDPATYMYGTDALWAKISPTNAWKMFDGTVSSQTIGKRIDDLTNETKISFSVQTVTAMNCISFFDTFVTRITLTLKRPDGTVVWSEVANITKDISASATDYFFSDKYEAPVNLFRMFPAVPGAMLDVEMYSPSTCKCGLCVIGKSRYIGKTQNGAKLSIVDYSKKSTSDYGVTSLSVGPYAKELACDLYLKNSDIDIIYDWIATIRATPIVVLGDNSSQSSVQYQSLMMYGYYSDFSVTIPGPVMSVCSFEVKGLI